MELQKSVSTIPTVLLSGFLGSGKTTLLNRFLRSPEARGTAVIVNEVGDTGIDQLVLAPVSDTISLLESGCLCCSLSGSLKETLLDIIQTANETAYPLNRIVIETTGLAEPVPILHSLLGDPVLTPRIHLSTVIVTIDSTLFLKQLTDHKELSHQAAVANQLIITKVDICDHETLRNTEWALQKINPRASITLSKNQPIEELFTHTQTLLLDLNTSTHNSDTCDVYCEQRDEQAVPADNSYHHRIKSSVITIPSPIYWPGIAAWWSLLSNTYGKRLLRCKGILHIEPKRQNAVLLQCVGDHFYPPRPITLPEQTEHTSKLVIIGVDITAHWLERSLVAFGLSDPYLKPSSIQELEELLKTL